MKETRVILSPDNRQHHIDTLLAQDGLAHIEEDPMTAYCPVSLTQTPKNVGEYVWHRQKILTEDVLPAAGIAVHDPGSLPTSPHFDLSALPQDVYLGDSAKVVSARFFVGHNIVPSTGVGVELEKATKYNRIAVILHDANIRISRMIPHRIIYLQYTNFEKQADLFTKVFKFLAQYDPGMGFFGNEAVLLGFHKETRERVNLEQLVYETFPELKYQYNGETPAVTLEAINPELFYEHKK